MIGIVATIFSFNNCCRFGEFGGRYVPESLMPACFELEAAFRGAWADPAFHAEFESILRDYGVPLLNEQGELISP